MNDRGSYGNTPVAAPASDPSSNDPQWPKGRRGAAISIGLTALLLAAIFRIDKGRRREWDAPCIVHCKKPMRGPSPWAEYGRCR